MLRGGNRAKKRCPIALIDGIQSSRGQGASSSGEDMYKEAGEKSKDLISKRFPKMMEVLLFLCVDPGHFLSTT